MEYLKNFTSSELTYRDKTDSLFSTCVLVDDDIYAFTNFKRLPIKCNLKTKEMILSEDLDGYDAQFTADEMLRVGNNIYVLELNGNRVMQYDIEQRKCNYYKIGCHKEAWGNYVAFAQWKGKLYIFPKYKGEVIKFETESGKVKKISNLFSTIGVDKLSLNSQNDNLFFCYGFQDGSIVWLFGRQSNLVFAYHLETDIWRKYELSEKINDCVHAVQYSGCIYILSSEGKVYSWDRINNSIKMLADCSDGLAEYNKFARITVTDKNFFLFPGFGKDIFYVDLKNRHMEKYRAYPSDFRYYEPDGWGKYYGYCENENSYYFAMRSMNFIACVNKRAGTLTWVRIILPETEKWRKKYIEHNKNMIDEKECNVKDVLNYLSFDYETKKNKDFVSIGNQIFEEIGEF